MSIKIGIAGTHSTGKTTVLDHVAMKLWDMGYSVARVSDLASEAQNLGFPILREHTFESTLWIISRGISEELRVGLTADVVLVDRPVPDALGYLLAALNFRDATLISEQMDYLRTVTRLHAATYSVLFKTQIDPLQGIGDNKERDRDIQFRALASEGIDRVFSDLELKFTSVPMDSREARDVVPKAVLALLPPRT